uniref:Uncharacterized protein n=1 Tax=Anguilla anguilla TaxID=7936 RepID=A0A0E9WGH6_ANGAN
MHPSCSPGTYRSTAAVGLYLISASSPHSAVRLAVCNCCCAPSAGGKSRAPTEQNIFWDSKSGPKYRD